MTETYVQNETIGCMDTSPGRFDNVRQAVESIAPQVDTLLLYVNETTEGLPEFLQIDNVRVFDGREHAGDLLANGKFYVQRYARNCRILTLNDDVIYPVDYVEKNLDILSAFDGRCAITIEGGVLPETVEWYYDRTHVIKYSDPVFQLQLCSIAGCDMFCFDQRWLTLEIDDLSTSAINDLEISLAARHAGLPIWVLPRYQNWLRRVGVHDISEHVSSSVELTSFTCLAREIDWSFERYAEIARNALSQAGVSPEQISMDPELAACLRHSGVPALWRGSNATYRIRGDYLNLLLQMQEDA